MNKCGLLTGNTKGRLTKRLMRNLFKCNHSLEHSLSFVNTLKPNDIYRGRTAPLTSKRCILYIYSTNIGTEYFKNGIYSQFFPLQNAVCFIILMYLVPVLFIFYIQNVLKLKKNNSGAKTLFFPLQNAVCFVILTY